MKVSIVTITFNSERTLKDTLESVLEQEYRPLQHIIQDGRSKDHTLEIVEAYQERYREKGIELKVWSEADHGISDAFNKGIEHADGAVIGIINSDDKLAEHAVECLMQSYKEDTDVYYGDCVIFNDAGRGEFVAVPKFSADPESLRKRMSLFHPSVFIASGAYKRFGLYDTSIRFVMDRDLLLKMYLGKAKFQYIPHPLAYYREGGTNQVNYKKCLLENMQISVRYGMNPAEASLRRYYAIFHDTVWKLIQRFGLERLFHRQISR